MSIGIVYVNGGKDFKRCLDEEKRRTKYAVDFRKLLELFARKVKKYNHITLIRNENDPEKEQFCMTLIRECIAEEVNTFLNTFYERKSVLQMKKKVSGRQIKRLMRFSNDSYPRITCYAVIIILIIYKKIENDLVKEQIDELLEMIRYFTNIFLLEHPDDLLAQYLAVSIVPVKKEIGNEIRCCENDFPDIMRWFPENGRP